MLTEDGIELAWSNRKAGDAKPWNGFRAAVEAPEVPLGPYLT